MAAVANTVEQILLLCGVPNDHILFNGSTKAERIAAEVFGDDFSSCMDISHEDFETECKSYSALTVAQGQIRLTPGTKRNIKAMIQWCREHIIVGNDPVSQVFNNTQQLELIRRYKAHQSFKEKSKSISDVAKPEKFTEDIKWVDWFPTFCNFLQAIPGSRGVPLSYVIRDDETPAPADDPTLHFLDNFVLRAPLTGDAYQIDNSEVHTYMVYFISGNSTAEARITAHGQNNDGRADFIALRQHYEGIGVNALEVSKAENVINSLFYSGEKKPHMWWSEFEKELSRAFAIVQKAEGRIVHSNDMKLRILMGKIQADFMQQAKAALMVDMSRVPMTLTYETAMNTFRNVVNNKHPPSVGSDIRTRRINEVSGQGRGNPGGGRFPRGGRGRGFNRGGRNNGRGRGRGRGHRGGGQGNSYNNTKPYYINGQSKSNNTWMTATQFGKAIECHPKASYPGEIWQMIPRQDKEKINMMRRNNSSNNSQSGSTISEITQGTQFTIPPVYQPFYQPAQPQPQQQMGIAQINTQPPIPPPPPPRAAPSQPTQVSIMGGRNEQASLRSRNPTMPPP